MPLSNSAPIPFMASIRVQCWRFGTAHAPWDSPYARSADFQSASRCELTRPVTFAPKRPLTIVATALIPAANVAPRE
jgi:hypothetical protein